MEVGEVSLCYFWVNLSLCLDGEAVWLEGVVGGFDMVVDGCIGVVRIDVFWVCIVVVMWMWMVG